jgi:hypothetical protein
MDSKVQSCIDGFCNRMEGLVKEYGHARQLID